MIALLYFVTWVRARRTPELPSGELPEFHFEWAQIGNPLPPYFYDAPLPVELREPVNRLLSAGQSVLHALGLVDD